MKEILKIIAHKLLLSYAKGHSPSLPVILKFLFGMQTQNAIDMDLYTRTLRKNIENLSEQERDEVKAFLEFLESTNSENLLLHSLKGFLLTENIFFNDDQKKGKIFTEKAQEIENKNTITTIPFIDPNAQCKKAFE